MIAASSVETEGNNKPSRPRPSPPKCFHSCLQNISLVFLCHEFKNGKNKSSKNERKSVQIH